MKNRIGFLKRDINQNKSRFIVVLIIVALSVGFLTGLVSIAPDMEYTADKYYDQNNFWDINIKSTLGFTPEDVIAIKDQEYVEDACGLITLDATASHNMEGNYPIRIYAVDFENDVATGQILSAPVLIDGSYPMNSTSCVVLRSYALKSDIGIGDKIYLKSGGDVLTEAAFTVTGIAESPEFASGDRQVSASGESTVAIAIYVLDTVYPSTDIYTDVLVTVKDADKLDTFSDEYVKKVSKAKSKLEKLSNEREKLREDSITDKHESDLGEATTNYTEYQEITQSQLAAQKKYVNSLKNDLEKSQKEIKKQKTELDKTKAALDLQLLKVEEIKQKTEPVTAEEKKVVSKYEQDLKKYNKDVKELEEKENVLKVDNTIYEQAKKSYEKNRKQVNKELANAKNEYEDYKEQERESGKQSWVMSDRTQNAGFLGFKSNIDKITAIAVVFPIIFFIIAIGAAAVIIRQLVIEKGHEIGIFKSFGYTEKMIVRRNVKYAFLVAVLGTASGLIIGVLALPLWAYKTYSVMYSYGPLKIQVLPYTVIPAIVLAILFTVGVAYMVSKKSLKMGPAKLISPKRFYEKGKFFEELEKICSYFKGSFRLALRNMIRHTNRVIILLVGIAGCTAILLAGLGLRDSVVNVDDLQYQGIQQYDVSVSLKKDVDFSKSDSLKKFLANKKYVKGYLPIYNEVLTYNIDGKQVTIMAVVPAKGKSFDGFVSLSSRKFNRSINLGEKGVVLTENTALSCGVKVGDTLKLRTATGSNIKLKVGAITENYVGNSIYISPAAYKKAVGSKVAANGLLVKYADKTKGSEFDEKIKNTGLILSSTYSSDSAEYATQKMSSIGYIVKFIILAAISLIVIVVYAVIDITISDRKAEIRAIKNIGFVNLKGLEHIYIEILLTSVLGIAIGLLFGAVLHFGIVSTYKMSDIMLSRGIGFVSFIIAIGVALIVVVASTLLSVIKTIKDK